MEPSGSEIDETLRRLRRAPRHFAAVARGLGDEQLRRPPAAGSWSVHEMLAHLRGCADVRGAWISRMLAEERPTIRYSSPRTGMKKTGHEHHAFSTFRRDFGRQRAGLVTTLHALEPREWLRRGTFTGTTPGWSPTVFELARGLADHEHAHFAQISEAAAALR